MFVSDSETRFASTLWYGVCGYLKSNTTYQNMRNILLNTSIHYLNLDLGDIKSITADCEHTDDAEIEIFIAETL